MEQAAGHADLRSLIAGDLRRLAALHADVPVLSLYLDLDPSEFGTQRARRSAYTSLVDEAHKHVEAYDTDHDGRVSLRADVGRAAAFLDDYSPKRGRGVAIFAASAADLFEAYTLPRPTRTRIVIDDSPHITPLVAAGDMRNWLIVLGDTRHGRFLHGNTDHLEEFEQVVDAVLGQHERQGTSDHQRWVEHEADQHLKRVAGEVDRHLGSRQFARILIGGPPDIAPRLEGHHLSNPAREKVAGRFEIEVPSTGIDGVRAAATPFFEEDERRHEREHLDRLADRLGMGERAAAGYADVRGALDMAAVDTLLFDDGFEEPEPGALERAVEDAVAQSAEILPLRHRRGELAAHGHIAALLRF